MTPSRIAELRALAGAATPGRIDVHRVDSADGSIDYQLQAADGVVLGYASDWGGNGRAKADAALWSQACNELPAALDEIERLRALLGDVGDRLRALAMTAHDRHGDIAAQELADSWADRVDAALKGSE